MARLRSGELTLDALLKQRELLIRKMTSGVLEVEQPQLGRTQYRSMEEMQEALAYLNALIDGASGDTAATQSRRRRPIYPVVQEY